MDGHVSYEWLEFFNSICGGPDAIITSGITRADNLQQHIRYAPFLGDDRKGQLWAINRVIDSHQTPEALLEIESDPDRLYELALYIFREAALSSLKRSKGYLRVLLYRLYTSLRQFRDGLWF